MSFSFSDSFSRCFLKFCFYLYGIQIHVTTDHLMFSVISDQSGTIGKPFISFVIPEYIRIRTYSQRFPAAQRLSV